MARKGGSELMDLQLKPVWHVAKSSSKGTDSAPQFESDPNEATLCMLCMNVNGALITRIVDEEQQGHDGPRVSAYRFAEWLLWNWWRLRWEPPRSGVSSLSWLQAHATASIGGGWIWPSVTFESDGETVCVRAAGTEATVTEPITFVVDNTENFVSAQIFESGIDSFISTVINRLNQNLRSTNTLSDMWTELSEERADPKLTTYRRLEALLGFNPDEGDSEVIQQLIKDREVLGDQAADEIAAEIPLSSGVSLSAKNLRELARESGFRVNDGDLAKTPMANKTKWSMESDQLGLSAPWRIGQDAAKLLRVSERLGSSRITNPVLSELCGLPKGALTKSSNVKPPIAFTWSSEESKRVVFRARVSAGRRFDAARLLADELLVQNGESLQPATNTHTFRQMVQRAFAAELLCPYDALISRLDGDYSEESIEAASKHFMVSPMLVSSTLENNGITNSGGTRYMRA